MTWCRGGGWGGSLGSRRGRREEVASPTQMRLPVPGLQHQEGSSAAAVTIRDLLGGQEGPRTPPSECSPHPGSNSYLNNLEFISIRSFSRGGSPWLLSYQLDMPVTLGQRPSKGPITVSTCSSFSSHSGHLIYPGNFSVGDHFCKSAGSKKSNNNTNVC